MIGRFVCFFVLHKLTSVVKQNVEENECRRAHDVAVEKYNQVFKKDVNPDEVSCYYLVQNKGVMCVTPLFACWPLELRIVGFATLCSL